MLKIKLFGYKGGVSPFSDLEKAFKELGCNVVQDEECDLIFDLTGFPDEAIEYSKKYPSAIKIFNLLNADINNPNWGDGRNVREQLLQADIPTTVSESTRKDIQKRTGVDCQVIYFPMKPIDQKPIPKGIDFLYVGRLFNKEKRFSLVLDTLRYLNRPVETLVTVGPENPGYGYYTGLVGDDELSLIYGSSQYLFCPCVHEGSMSMLEAIIADCFPLVCNDNNWVYEFGLDDFACDPTPQSLAAKYQDIEKKPGKYVHILDDLKPKLLEKFQTINVAKRVLDLYHSYRMR